MIDLNQGLFDMPLHFALIAKAVISIRLILLTLFYIFINNKTSDDGVWAWMFWGIVDFPSTLLINSDQIIDQTMRLFNTSSSNLVLLILHATIGSIYWVILVSVVFWLWRVFIKKLE